MKRALASSIRRAARVTATLLAAVVCAVVNLTFMAGTLVVAFALDAPIAGLAHIAAQAVLLLFLLDGLGDEDRNPIAVIAIWAAATCATVAIFAHVV